MSTVLFLLLLRDHLDVVLTLALGLTFSQILGSSFILLNSNILARLSTINTKYLSPIIIVLCLGGAYCIRMNIYDVFLAVGSGILGFFLKYYGFPIIPMAIGYILGGLAAKAFRQSLMMNYGDYSIFFSSSICFILIFLILLLYLSPFLKPTINKMRKSDEEI